LDFPVNEELIKRIIDKGKIYDCIYFGVLSKLKGTFDFIRVIAEIKGKKSDVMACIVGGGDISPFRQLAQEMKCENNIHFIGFVKSQRELFDYVKASKILLAPPYFDRLSATIREAMFLKIPIVAYATGGIPYVNEFEENIFLVKTGDYKRMAQRAIHLLEDELLRKNLAEKAYQYYLKEFSIDVTTDRFITAYKTIINDKKNYKPE
jgi:glycosyltransferase involved in cell wall biosynthesis